MPSEHEESRVTDPTSRRTTKLSVATLSLFVSLHCNVYDASLLGTGESPVGGRATMGGSGASAARGGTNSVAGGGVGGDSEVASGAPGAGLGGLSEMAGAIETGGDGASGGSAGNAEGGAVTGGTGGAIGGTGGAAVGGATQTANGCAKLSVPFDAASDKAHFVISLNSPADLSGATISMRLYVEAGMGGSIFNYVQDSGTYHFLGVPAAQRRLLSGPSTWSTLSWNVGTEDAAATGIVKTSIKNIGIELNAQPSASWSNPTIVYIDSLTVTSPTLSFTFDAKASVYPTPTTTSATAEALWLNNGATDTTAAGAMLSWEETCP
jgi:hypothetical protein